MNLIAATYAYLMTLGFHHLAILLTSTPVRLDGEYNGINTTVNKNRIPQDIKDQLQYWFPYNKVVNKDRADNLVEDFINNIANSMYDVRWLPNAPRNIVDEYIPDGELLPTDLKIRLAKFIIKHEELLDKQNYKLKGE